MREHDLERQLAAREDYWQNEIRIAGQVQESVRRTMDREQEALRLELQQHVKSHSLREAQDEALRAQKQEEAAKGLAGEEEAGSGSWSLPSAWSPTAHAPPNPQGPGAPPPHDAWSDAIAAGQRLRPQEDTRATRVSWGSYEPSTGASRPELFRMSTPTETSPTGSVAPSRVKFRVHDVVTFLGDSWVVKSVDDDDKYTIFRSDVVQPAGRNPIFETTDQGYQERSVSGERLALYYIGASSPAARPDPVAELRADMRAEVKEMSTWLERVRSKWISQLVD